MHSDDRYRRAAAAGGVGIWEWDVVTQDSYVDPILKEMLGYEPAALQSHQDLFDQLVHPDDRAAVIAWTEAMIAGGAEPEIEHRMIHRDGSIRWFVARASVMRDPQGAAIRMVGTDTDITSRKHSEEALRQSEALNRRIAESTGDCVKILDLEGRLLYMNPEGLRQLEIDDVTPLLHRSIMASFDDEVRRAGDAAIDVARRGGTGRFQAMLRTSSGAARWFDIVVTPVTDAKGGIVQLLAVSRDITDRKREEAFRATYNQVLAMIATGCPLYEVLDCLVHLVEQQSEGMRCSVLLLDDDGVHVQHGSAPSLPAEYILAINGSAIGPRAGSCGTAMFLGTRVIVSDILSNSLWDDYRELAQRCGLRACWSTPIFSPQRKVLGSFAMYYDQPRTPTDDELELTDSAADLARIAIERERAQQALQHSEARNRAMLRAIPDWMFLTTIDGVFLDYHARDSSALHASPSSFLGRTVAEVLPPSVAGLLAGTFARVAASDVPETVEYSMGSDEDEHFYEACVVCCDGDKLLSIVRDTTSSRRAALEANANRRELAHLGRVAMLGELTGALAHELSQPLTAVMGNTQAVRRLVECNPPDMEEIREAIDDIIKDTKRAGAVIERLRALLRKEASPLQPVNLNEVVREVVDIAHSEVLSRRIVVRSTLMPDIPLVLGDHIQLQQVVLNLVLNACDAMSGTPAASRHLMLATAIQGSSVQLLVSDSGVGIPDDQLEKVFEPFVTFRDRGLGLGLAISRSIVRAHQGSIKAENNVDGGATFRCLLPVACASPGG